MYVSQLDIPWEQTDFPLQGLLIRSLDDIEKLSGYCKRVYIDEQRSQPNLQMRNAQFLQSVKQAHFKAERQHQSSSIEHNWKQTYCVERYVVESSFKSEVYRSIDIFDKVEKQVHHFCKNIIRCRKADIEEVVEHTSQVVDSIIRNPDAFAWLCRIRETRQPIYLHSIRLAVWGGIVGRQLGLNRFSLTHLCSVLLLSGIGKSQISAQALAGYCATKTTREYQKHLHETLYQLRQIRMHTDDLVHTLENYCERIDGSGFPNHKKAAAIPFLAQVAGLIETYELLIHPYEASRAISPANAIVFLNRSKDKTFSASLVEEFIRAIGIYPTGTLVELSDGQLGVVVSQNYEKRLRASVIPIVSGKGHILDKFQVLDLCYTDRREGEDDQIYIRRGVPSSNIPRGLLEKAHEWMFEKNGGMRGLLRSFL